MIPVAILIEEHKIIMRMVDVLKNAKGRYSPAFIEKTVDFFRTYAEKCHHGKEENILFRRLEKKELLPVDKKILQELIEEHKMARELVQEFAESKTGAGDKIVSLYERHIEKENRKFFLPAFNYFSHEEKEDILKEFMENDRKMIHEKYAKVVDEIEAM